jgi:hypothetical protein
MFQKNQRRETVEQQVADTVVSAGTILEGRLEVEGSLRIDGRMDGTLTVKGLLLVGAGAEIRADVEAVDPREPDGEGECRTSTGVPTGGGCFHQVLPDRGWSVLPGELPYGRGLD